jgi:hypothetical protein
MVAGPSGARAAPHRSQTVRISSTDDLPGLRVESGTEGISIALDPAAEGLGRHRQVEQAHFGNSDGDHAMHRQDSMQKGQTSHLSALGRLTTVGAWATTNERPQS